MSFEDSEMHVVSSIDPLEGQCYVNSVRGEFHEGCLDNIYDISSTLDDYINPTIDGKLSWQSVSLFSSDSREALENWQNRLYEVSTRKCARFTNFLRWVGTKVCDLDTYDGLPNLYTFLTELKVKILETQRFLAIDVALKATPIRWWVSHKQFVS